MSQKLTKTPKIEKPIDDQNNKIKATPVNYTTMSSTAITSQEHLLDSYFDVDSPTELLKWSIDNQRVLQKYGRFDQKVMAVFNLSASAINEMSTKQLKQAFKTVGEVQQKQNADGREDHDQRGNPVHGKAAGDAEEGDRGGIHFHRQHVHVLRHGDDLDDEEPHGLRGGKMDYGGGCVVLVDSSTRNTCNNDSNTHTVNVTTRNTTIRHIRHHHLPRRRPWFTGSAEA